MKFNFSGFKETLKLFKFLVPYKAQYAVGIVMLILSTLTTLTFPVLVGEMTKVLERKSEFSLNEVALIFACILLAQGIFSYFRVLYFSRVSEKATADIRTLLYKKMISSPLSFLKVIEWEI